MEERIERTERTERTERSLTPTVHKILYEEAVSSKKPRVAAYCRVSTDLEDQATSFAMQVRTYEERIKNNPDWEFAGIFADEGITGTSAAKRPQFQAMIRACDEGKIDIIYTKSISRFARNTLECLSYVNQLEKDGVAVIFENDRIDTRTKESKLLFTILANFAEEESRSISEKTYPDKVNGNYKVWLCRGRKAGCKMRAIREEELIKLILEEAKKRKTAKTAKTASRAGWTHGDVEQISREIDRIEIFTDRIEVSWKDSELGFDSFSTFA